jgi:hypothetical protein
MKLSFRAGQAELQRRQDNLISQLETFEPTGDADADRVYRQSIQRRFAELAASQRAKRAELDHLDADTSPDDDDAELLDHIPLLGSGYPELPEELERRLYDAFQLKLRYNRTRHEATLQVTVREDTVKVLTAATQRIHRQGHKMPVEHGEHQDLPFPCSARPLQCPVSGHRNGMSQDIGMTRPRWSADVEGASGGHRCRRGRP